MPQDPLVSVVVPLFNAENFIAASIESVLEQTWANIELIVIDDHSSDNSWNIASSYENESVQIVRNSINGAAAARNYGLSLAKGDYVQFLDADDLLASEKIEYQIDLLKNYPHGTIASCSWGRFLDDPKKAEFSQEAVWQDYPVAWKWLLDSWEGGGMMQTGSWLVPREVITEAGPWNEALSLNDDGEYFSRILLKCTGVAFSAFNGVYYRSSAPNSLSRRTDSHAIESAFETCRLYERHVKDAGLEIGFRRALRLNYLSFIYQHYPSRKDLMKQAWRRVDHLGGSSNEEIGGALFQQVAGLVGFRNALRLRTVLRHR